MSNSHLTDKAILIHRPSLLPTRQPRRLRPHLLHILKHHVAVAIESLDARQQLAVVAARDQHLRVRAHCRLQNRERAAGEFVLLKGCDLKLAAGLLAGCRAGVGEMIGVEVWGNMVVAWGGAGTYVRSLRGFASSSLAGN